MLTKNILCAVGLLGLLTGCHPPRTIFLRNYSAQAVTLVFPKQPRAGFLPGTPSTVRFTPKGAQRDSVLTYGPGSWTVADQEQLQQVLQQSRLVMGTDTVSLADRFQLIGTYRVLVNEFYVKIMGVEDNTAGAVPAR